MPVINARKLSTTKIDYKSLEEMKPEAANRKISAVKNSSSDSSSSDDTL